MTTTRRTFMAAGATSLAGVPALALLGQTSHAQAPTAPDPMLVLIDSQVRGIYDALLAGDRSPVQMARLEQVLRFQAVHCRQHVDGPATKGLREHFAAAGGRGAFAAQVLAQGDQCCATIEREVRKHYPKYKRPRITPPSVAALATALEKVERTGLSARFEERADALAEFLKKAPSQPRVVPARLSVSSPLGGASPQSWYDWFCGWWDTSRQIDDALLQAFCAFAFLAGWSGVAPVLCAMWAIENSAEDLMYMIIC